MIALELFSEVPPGWSRVQAICDWVHTKVAFGYQYARPTKSALDVYTERFGVCRDFQHLAVTLCRALNIPARYATGYLGDIGVPPSGTPMDFSAWFEVYLDDRWWPFDAREQSTPYRSGSHGHRPRRCRCSHHHLFRPSQPHPLHRDHRAHHRRPGNFPVAPPSACAGGVSASNPPQIPLLFDPTHHAC